MLDPALVIKRDDTTGADDICALLTPIFPG